MGRHYKNVRQLKKRFADVGLLTEAYFKVKATNPAPRMTDLLGTLQKRGLKLYNPISKDENKPCYRINERADTIDLAENPNLVIIEETGNVNDYNARVRSRADGSINLENVLTQNTISLQKQTNAGSMR